MTEGHTVKRFDGEMTRLHGLVLELGRGVVAQIEQAVATLQNEDPGAARRVIDRDNEINQLDVRAEDELFKLLATRQPMARDLREMITVNHMVRDLERVGDQARKIAQLTVHLYDNDTSPPNGQILRDVVAMAGFVGPMVAQAVEAFDRLDLDRALAVMRKDLELEAEFRSALRRQSTFLMEDARNVGHVIDVVLALRALERIGGYAKNIGGYVVFLVTGKDVRHETVAAVEARLREQGG
jgi:phosphate transport system protein